MDIDVISDVTFYCGCKNNTPHELTIILAEYMNDVLKMQAMSQKKYAIHNRCSFHISKIGFLTYAFEYVVVRTTARSSFSACSHRVLARRVSVWLRCVVLRCIGEDTFMLRCICQHERMY